MLERELELAGEKTPQERAALLRRLGDVQWRRLNLTTRASRSYAAAIEAWPRNFGALRALQRLLETMEDWRGALDLYESEVEVLGDSDAERRCEALLRAGELARDRVGEPERALRAYESAAALGPLPTPRLRELAALQESCGRSEAFTETFAAWCDAEDSCARAVDHERLAAALEEQGREEDARDRIERALAIDGESVAAWPRTWAPRRANTRIVS